MFKMENAMALDVDPLSPYEAQYNYRLPNPHYYPHPSQAEQHGHQIEPPSPRTEPNSHPVTQSSQNVPFTYQHEQPQDCPQVSYQPQLPTPTDTDYLPTIAQEMAEQDEQPATIVEEEDIKPDIEALEAAINKQKKLPPSRRPKGRTSSYWNKKITDKDFAFYGCSICDIAFMEIGKLDQHVTMHSNRITTYEVRMMNLRKRKQLKKQKKKLKKEAKVKKESELEIKPEDGYIGPEKASELDEENKEDVKNVQDIAEKASEALNGDVKNVKKLKVNNENSPAFAKSENEKKYVHAYKCFGCNKLFALSYYLRLHVRSHTGEKPYTCQDCGQNFITASKMGRHRKRIHLATRHQCRICFRVFTRFELLVKHFDSKHASDKLDGEPYDYNAILPYIKELEEQLRLDNEKKMKKPKPEDPWGQPVVTDSAVHDVMDEAKEILFITKQEDKVELPQNIEFYDENNTIEQNAPVLKEVKIDLEVIKKEADDHDVDDDHCLDDRGFQDDDDGEALKYNDAGSDEEYVPSKTWVRPHSPLIKKKQKKRENKVKCPVCDRMVFSKIALKKHMSSHTGEKPFRCDICDRSFAYKHSYKRHIVDHHGDNTTDNKEDIKPKEEPTNGTTGGDEEPLSKLKAKMKDAPSSDEEYFPSQTWVRPPSPLPEGPASPPVGSARGNVCHICNKTVSSKTYLAVHIRTHTGEKPFSCYICGRGFITSSKMHRHVLTHNESWEGKDAIKTENDREENMDADAEDKKDIFDKEFIDKAKAKLHTKISKMKFFGKKDRKNKKWTHACDICNKKFLHLETMQVHKKTHDHNDDKKCYFCLEQHNNVEGLKACHDSHTGPKPFQCNLCRRQFAKKGTLVTHKKKCDGVGAPVGGKKYLCDMCNKSYNSHAKLQRHLASHAGAQYSLRYECPVCAHMFHTRYHVQMHLRTHMKEGLILEQNRNAVLAMVLQNARKIPKTPEAPLAPLADTPHDERSRICNICGQIFQHFYYLEEHLKTHGSKIALEDFDEEEEKKHTCQVCSKSFKLPYYLKLHSYTHTKEKPFICQQCGKGFITKGKLKRHLETHQGLKKYQCHICYKFFTRPSYLRIHVRTIHGTQDYNFREFGIGVPIGLSQE